KKERKRSTQEIAKALEKDTSQISGMRANVYMPQPPLASVTRSSSGDNLGLTIMSTGNYRKLQQVSSQVLDLLKPLPLFVHVDNSLKWDSEQFQININRERAADLHVPVLSITNTLATLIAGRNVGKMDESNILLQMRKDALGNPNIFSQI